MIPRSADRVADVVVVTLLVLVAVILATTSRNVLPVPAPGGPAGLALALVVQVGPVLVRRTRPVAALLVCSAAEPLVAALFGVAPVITWSVLVFGVLRRCPRPGSVVVALLGVGGGLAATAAVIVAALPGRVDGATALGVATGLLAAALPVLATAAVLGVAARARAAAGERRAAEAERARVASALDDARDRLAADLRTLVAVRVERLLDAVRVLPPGIPDGAALDPVVAEARGALAGMRRALAVLRTDDPETGPEAGTAPASGPGSGPSRSAVPTRSGVGLAVAAAALLVTAATLVARVPPADRDAATGILDVDPAHPVGLLALALEVGALAWWRRAPLTAFSAATVGSLLAALAGATHVVAEAGWMVLVYAAGCGAPARRSAVVVAVGTAAIALGTVVLPVPAAVAGLGADQYLLSYALVPVLWAVGARQRRAALAEDRARALRARESADRAVRAQRLGLARDLHDVLAHELSALVVAVRAARVAGGDEAEGAVRAGADRIAAALPALTRPGGDPPPTRLDRAGLDALVAASGAAGLPVDVVVTGDGTARPAETDVVGARIVTEALTNVLRHAGPTPTRVDVRHGAEETTLEVLDAGPVPGHRPPTRGAGLGVRGLRERVAAVGGTVEVGPVPDATASTSGWRVRARLPHRDHGLLLGEEAPASVSSSRGTSGEWPSS